MNHGFSGQHCEADSAPDQWTPFSWHCPNCGNLVTGFRNARGTIKVKCGKCQAVMVRIVKSRRCDSIDIYAAG